MVKVSAVEGRDDVRGAIDDDSTIDGQDKGAIVGVDLEGSVEMEFEEIRAFDEIFPVLAYAFESGERVDR